MITAPLIDRSGTEVLDTSPGPWSAIEDLEPPRDEDDGGFVVVPSDAGGVPPATMLRNASGPELALVPPASGFRERRGQNPRSGVPSARTGRPPRRRGARGRTGRALLTPNRASLVSEDEPNWTPHHLLEAFGSLVLVRLPSES